MEQYKLFNKRQKGPLEIIYSIIIYTIIFSICIMIFPDYEGLIVIALTIFFLLQTLILSRIKPEKFDFLSFCNEEIEYNTKKRTYYYSYNELRKLTYSVVNNEDIDPYLEFEFTSKKNRPTKVKMDDFDYDKDKAIAFILFLKNKHKYFKISILPAGDQFQKRLVRRLIQ